MLSVRDARMPGVIGRFDVTARIWRWDGDAAWHFVTLPDDVAADVRDLTAGLRRGFGSVRVEAAIGATTWRTSLFPDAGSGSFVLPVKRSVRAAEGLTVGDDARIRVTLLDL
jgi:hypothetical protein